MADLRDNWKNTGTDLGKAFKHLGQSIVKSAKTGIQKADEWANSEDYVQPDANTGTRDSNCDKKEQQ